MKKTLIRTLACIAIAAIVAAVGRSCQHNNQNNNIDMNKTTYLIQVTQNKVLTYYDITDCPLDLACGQMPDTAQADVLLCAAAAFTGKCLDYFEHSNILGPHISQGVLYEGYTEEKDGVPFEQRYALFVWEGKDEQGNMLPKKFYQLPNDAILQQTVKQGGMAFTQHWVIKDGEVFTPCIQPLERVEHFRSLCQKDNRYYVIANHEEMKYQDYLQALLDAGVENALYMDMGAGWNHSFYRDANGQVHIIHPKGHSYPTNWIVVKRKV